MNSAALLILLAMVSSSVVSSKDEDEELLLTWEEILIEDLLDGYNDLILPVSNANETVKVMTNMIPLESISSL
jgi:hypothetical protein